MHAWTVKYLDIESVHGFGRLIDVMGHVSFRYEPCSNSFLLLFCCFLVAKHTCTDHVSVFSGFRIAAQKMHIFFFQNPFFVDLR